MAPPLYSYSYQNAFTSQTRLDLTARLVWTVGLQATQGQINSFTQTQDPATELIQGISLVATDFISLGASSLLVWEPTARIKISQPIHFRSFIPYGTITPQNADGMNEPTVNATQSLQSYSLDGGVGIDRQWARTSLGTELLVGWFLPQQGVGQMVSNDESVVTAQLIVRGTAELTPRWHLEGNVGVFVATEADHFLQGQVAPAAPTDPALSGTLVSPVGGAEVRYQFPGALQAGVGLSYLHAATGEVLLGGLTISDAVTLRGFLPLPKEVVLSASAGYRHSDLAGNGGFSSSINAGDSGYDMGQADAAVSWNAKRWLVFYARYSYLYQRPFANGPVIAGAPVLGDLNRHLATVGVAFTYPQK
jgi:hypothetical protein